MANPKVVFDVGQIKEGYLLKRSPMLKQWRKRYMVLEMNHNTCKLYSYNDVHDKSTPTEIIDVKAFTTVKTTNLNKLEFELSSPVSKKKKGSLVSRQFRALSAEDMSNWVNCLTCAIHGDGRYIYHDTKLCVHRVKINVICKTNKQHNFDFFTKVECEATLQSIVSKVLDEAKKYPTKKFRVRQIGREVVNTDDVEMFQVRHVYSGSGEIDVIVDFEPYKHLVTSVPITCPHMMKINTKNPLQCPLYYGMKENYEWNQENLNHVDNFTHFKDEYTEKPECKYKDQCYGYLRLDKGGHLLSDRCHMKLFRHPPRSRRVKLAENIHSLIINDCEDENHPLYKPTEDDQKQYKYNKNDGYLLALIEEVKNNGFDSDLHLPDDDLKQDDYSLLKIVDWKMKSNRHKLMASPLNMAEMLSLILYTGCDCNYDLCSSQRNEDYDKWKWFDYCLWNAIYKL
eukprot:423250_1